MTKERRNPDIDRIPAMSYDTEGYKTYYVSRVEKTLYGNTECKLMLEYTAHSGNAEIFFSPGDLRAVMGYIVTDVQKNRIKPASVSIIPHGANPKKVTDPETQMINYEYDYEIKSGGGPCEMVCKHYCLTPMEARYIAIILNNFKRAKQLKSIDDVFKQ